MNFPRDDDDAKDIRELITNTRGWLALVEGMGDQMSLTDKLLVANINITTAMVIAIGQQTGVLHKQTTSVARTLAPSVYMAWANPQGITEDVLQDILRYVEARVPDWQQRKIVAIKEIRTYTGLGLKDSKDLIDIMSANPNPWWR